jgi:hypothetical protein
MRVQKVKTSFPAFSMITKKYTVQGNDKFTRSAAHYFTYTFTNQNRFVCILNGETRKWNVIQFNEKSTRFKMK